MLVVVAVPAEAEAVLAGVPARPTVLGPYRAAGTTGPAWPAGRPGPPGRPGS